MMLGLAKKIVQDFFIGRHNKILVINSAHYAKDVLPKVREFINKLYVTLNKEDLFFENFIQGYSILNKDILSEW